ncbi:type VI secretion-associated lipoprotein TagQ [Pseudomonas fluorescens]|uniref:Type VI secretion-associated lipoprotein TagQ n=1 Tax=Pseudomonas fluorescens TaxID=294 RepID=A0A379ILU1_PSEFL|nr:hypothetical protein HZ99_17055 [Pseudomonas fluorescens]SUD34723.1 type VI secretion-associated lipoprotein TagQ [Pseudomonas fluorescens]
MGTPMRSGAHFFGSYHQVLVGVHQRFATFGMEADFDADFIRYAPPLGEQRATDFNKSASDIDRSTVYAKASQQCYQSAFTKLVADRKASEDLNNFIQAYEKDLQQVGVQRIRQVVAISGKRQPISC